MTILDKIIEQRKQDVSTLQYLNPISKLERSAFFERPVMSAKEYILSSEKSGIIAEHKRASPSKGIINNKANLADVVTGYENAGASCISILTEPHFFKGSSEDILHIRDIISIPILRKEFIVDEYQIIEAKSMGADFILLIAACLTKQEINTFTKQAHSLNMEVLCEIHEEQELEKCNSEIDIIGVNNRNLKDFSVDLEHSIRLLEKIPESFVRISESGISQAETVKLLKSKGFQGFLMGENFMKHGNPGEACREFISESQLL